MRNRTFCLGLLAACLLVMLAACAGDTLPASNTPVSLAAPAGATDAAPTPGAPATRVEAVAPDATSQPGTTPTTAEPTASPTAAEPTATPTVPALSATPRPSPLPSPTPAGPKILSFTAAPTTTRRLGETITLAWQGQGDQATLCPFVLGVGGPAPVTAACVDVPPVGSRKITVTENDLDWSGMLLRLTAGAATAQSVVTLTLGCEGWRDWFFAHPPERCPQGAAITTPAAAQRFERGWMVWLQQPDRFYVIFDETPQVFQWIEAPYHFKPGASPDNRVAEAPPAGLVEPVSGFGQLWRGEFEGVEPLRSRLGWARQPELGYTARTQCARSMGRLWSCFLGMPDGRVLALHPDSSAQVRFLWEAW